MRPRHLTVSRFGIEDSLRSTLPGIDNGRIQQIASHQPHHIEILTDDDGHHFFINPHGNPNRKAEVLASRRGLGGSGCPLYDVVAVELLDFSE